MFKWLKKLFSCEQTNWPPVGSRIPIPPWPEKKLGIGGTASAYPPPPPKYNGVRRSEPVVENKSSNDGDFATSLIIGAVTNNAVLGGIMGGSFSGGLMGDVARDGSIGEVSSSSYESNSSFDSSSSCDSSSD